MYRSVGWWFGLGVVWGGFWVLKIVSGAELGMAHLTIMTYSFLSWSISHDGSIVRVLESFGCCCTVWLRRVVH